MIYSKIYRLDTPDTEWQITHLFEHLLIRGFYSMLDVKNIQFDFISWINGHSFEGALFIDTLFYTEELANEFDRYIRNLPVFSEKELLYAIAGLQSEDKVIISTNDMPSLRKEIDKLRNREWNTPPLTQPVQTEIPKPTILTEKRASKNFRDIVIITRAKDLTPDEQKILLRVQILISDLIDSALVSIPSIYRHNDSKIARQHQDQAMAFVTKYTTAKEIALKDIKDVLTTITTTEIPKLEELLDNHFRVFSSEPLWQSMPIDYFRSTGILTTNQEISTLATTDNVYSILSKTSFQVRRLTPEIEAYINR